MSPHARWTVMEEWPPRRPHYVYPSSDWRMRTRRGSRDWVFSLFRSFKPVHSVDRERYAQSDVELDPSLEISYKVSVLLVHLPDFHYQQAILYSQDHCYPPSKPSQSRSAKEKQNASQHPSSCSHVCNIHFRPDSQPRPRSSIPPHHRHPSSLILSSSRLPIQSLIQCRTYPSRKQWPTGTAPRLCPLPPRLPPRKSWRHPDWAWHRPCTGVVLELFRLWLLRVLRALLLQNRRRSFQWEGHLQVWYQWAWGLLCLKVWRADDWCRGRGIVIIWRESQSWAITVNSPHPYSGVFFLPVFECSCLEIELRSLFFVSSWLQYTLVLVM